MRSITPFFFGSLVLALSTLAPASIAAADDWDEDPARIRFGADGGLGIAYTDQFDDYAGAALAAQVRLGVQFNSLFALYAQTGVLGMVYDAPLSGDDGIQGDVAWANAIGLDFTFGHVFQIGVAGGADFFRGNHFTDFYPAVEGRIALLLGTQGPGARGAFSIALKNHTTIITERSAAVDAGSFVNFTYLTLGFELY